jgi:RND family efflux transporter MFP subunit
LLLPTALVLLAPIALFAMRGLESAPLQPVGGHSEPTVISSREEIKTSPPEGTFLGAVLSREAVDVSVREAGTVVAVHVRMGDRVQKGDLLVSLDARLADSDLASAQAAASSQQIELQLAGATSSAAREHEARVLLLAKEGLASVEQTAEATRDRKLAALRVERARTALAEKAAQVVRLQQEKELKEVRAPFDGTVAARYVDPGVTVAATPPKPLVRIIGAEGLFVRFAVPEARLPALHLGGRVRIQPRGASTALAGTIERISPEIDPGTRIAFAEASIDESAATLVSGAAADVSLDEGGDVGAPPSKWSPETRFSHTTDAHAPSNEDLSAK